MNRFNFNGVIPSSKSHFNRALICASYGKNITLAGHSSCDDVIKMQTALDQLGSNSVYDCGSAGTVLRFLVLRLSRIAGTHELRGTERLLSRPQEDLKDILNQLGVELKFHSDHLTINSPEGWRPKNNVLKVNRTKSSQFASGLILNCWNLDFPLKIEWDSKGIISEGYWQMSVQVVKDFGMDLIQDSTGVIIPAKCKPNIDYYRVESDVSSAFAIAAYAALNGQATFQEFPFNTLQPDKIFIEILEKMGVGIEKQDKELRIIKKPTQLQGIHWNLAGCPDLFPVLATLCGFAKGMSRLDGAPHLVFKESNRIEKTGELLKRMGVEFKTLSDGMEIYPPEALKIPTASFEFDTDHDHRIAFAAALVASQKFPIQILNQDVVNKSFPEFWDILNDNTEGNDVS